MCRPTSRNDQKFQGDGTGRGEKGLAQALRYFMGTGSNSIGESVDKMNEDLNVHYVSIQDNIRFGCDSESGKALNCN